MAGHSAGHRHISASVSKKWIIPLAATAVVAGVTVGVVVSHDVSATASDFVSIYPPGTVPTTKTADDPHAVELGVRFTVHVPGALEAVRYYKGVKNTGVHTGTLWAANGTKLATATFANESASGWQTVRFPKPIALSPNQTYVASYHTSTGDYAQQQWAFSRNATLGNKTIRASSGIYAYGAGGFPRDTWHDAAYYVDVLFQPNGIGVTPPAPTPTVSSSRPSSPAASHTPTPPRSSTSSRPSTSPSTSAKPTASSTASPPPTKATTPAPTPSGSTSPPSAGVPAGVALTPYTGPSTITKDGTVIDGKSITGPLEIAAHNVVITRSRITGGDEAVHVSGSLSLSDSTVTGADDGVGGDNYTATRVEVTGLSSDGFKLGNNVHIDQAWCHDDTPTPASHADCVQMQAGVVNSWVKNSWLVGGRNSAIFLSPDLGPSTNGPLLIDNNVLGGGNYTLYCVAGNNGEYTVKNITITNNRFLRTGQYGPATVGVPVTASNNVWFDTGKPIPGPLN